jgi:hypothetical protein
MISSDLVMFPHLVQRGRHLQMEIAFVVGWCREFLPSLAKEAACEAADGFMRQPGQHTK